MNSLKTGSSDTDRQNYAELALSIQQQTNDLLYTNLASSLLSALIASLLTSWILWAPEHATQLRIWLLVLFGITGIRYLLRMHYFRTRHLRGKVKAGRASFIAASWAAGLAWGSLVIFIDPTDNFFSLMIISCILIGVSAVAISSQAASMTSSIGFLLLALLPLLVYFMTEPSMPDTVPVVLILLMLGILLKAAKQQNQVILNNITLAAASNFREQALRESEERLESHFKHTPLPAIEWSLDGRVIAWNPSAERLSGYSRDQALHKHISELLAKPQDENPNKPKLFDEEPKETEPPQSWRLLLDPNHSGTFLFDITARDGTRHNCEWHNAPIKRADGSVSGVSSFLLDRTEEVTARERQQRLIDIIQNTTDFVAIFNLEGDILFMNRAGREIMGYSLDDDLADKNLAGIFPASEIDQLLNEGVPSAYMNRTWSGETQLISIDGRMMTVDQLIVLHEATKSGQHYFSMVMRDISDRKQVERELFEAKEKAESAAKAKSEFLAMMSHEIRTPMNGVLGMAELLAGTKLDDEQQEFLEVITQSGNSLLGIINDILDFSKAEAGKIELEAISFDLERTIYDAVRLLSANASSKGLELIISYPPELPRQVMGDAGRIRQIITNLAGNAIKFTQQGHIAINVETTKATDGTSRFRISVIDTGIGIPEAQQQRLFKSFTQADSSTTRKYGGTGLGLAISKQLVELMGGSIGVSSTQGEGSTFWLEIPLGLSQPREPLGHADLSRLKCLILDDNLLNQRIFRDQLRSCGMQIHTVTSGDEALTLATEMASANKPFDIFLLDFNLPGINGEQIALRLRQMTAYKETPMILLTSSGNRGDAKHFEEVGFDAYLIKPVPHQILHEAIEGVVSNTLQHKEQEIITQYHVIEGHTQPSNQTEHIDAKILLVEDLLPNQKVASSVLSKMGCTVEIADNGRIALERLAEDSFDIVLMDCQMPEMDGLETTRAIRQRERDTGTHTPIIAMTANNMASDRKHCLEAGMDDFISKPFEREQLAKLLGKWLNPESPSAAEAEMHYEAPEFAVPTSMLESLEVIDQNGLEQMQQLLGDEFGELLDAFFISLDELISLLPQALADSDQQEIRRIAHSIKSAGNNVSARRLAKLGSLMEACALESAFQQFEGYQDQLQQEIQLVSDALAEYR
ncbi:PAS domain S-box [endosymbiont of Ridgeia piscesae]|jgi:PAS domain S-box-containing protein|uniref:Sensory/regulatory protein RpfC n=3 Tax=endosymbiont of Ridgeia piscesae TaxID=54398 RepID=A0A0T5YZS2_9GAMM|nr:response regulator [endosymbiont of Ridgeia piscesae]KRT55969.1 PAS domain S-box [endosymbiont of Ridgeia piscesae]